MDEIRLHAFSGLTGAHITRLEFASLSWSDSINEEGSLTATVRGGDVGTDVRPYGTIVAATIGTRILHAGYVTHVRRASEDMRGFWEVEAGGGLTILDKRLVMNHALDGSWRNGNVVVDEDNPSGNWPLSIRGTYSDLVSYLIRETEKWGALPITPAAIQGGSSHERNYNSYDLATVFDRIRDITQLDDGPEVRLDPELSSNWAISFRQRTADEIIDSRWTWNARLPGSGVVLVDQDADGEDMCSQCYATGGRDDDRLLVCRATSNALTNRGWPVLQIANTQHSSVSQLATLMAYARADVAAGDSTQDVFGLTVPIDLDVRPGDWADVRTDYGVLSLKVVDVSGEAGGGRLSVQCRERV